MIKMTVYYTMIWIAMELSNVIAIKEVSMDKRCGEILSMILEDAYQMKITLDDLGEGPNVCELTLVAWYTWPRMMIYFEDLIRNCSHGYIEMFDGSFDGTEMQDDNECQSSSFKFDNGRCIEDSIRCNGHNSCGDHSDCRLNTYSLIRTATVVGCVFGIVTLATVAVISCRVVRRNDCRKPHKETKSSTTEQRVYTTKMSGHSCENLEHPLFGCHPNDINAMSPEEDEDGLDMTKSLTAAKKPAYPVSWLGTRKVSFKE